MISASRKFPSIMECTARVEPQEGQGNWVIFFTKHVLKNVALESDNVLRVTNIQ